MLSCTTNYQNNIYANARQINSRITFTLNGTSTVYDDTYITQMNITEEMSTLSDSLPSDELQVTLDNTSGTFDFLNMSSMYQILAQRPIIVPELGLVYSEPYNGIVNSSFEDFPSTTIATDWIQYNTPTSLSKVTGYEGNGQQIICNAGVYGGINSGYDLTGVKNGDTVYLRFLYKGTKPNYVFFMTTGGNYTATLTTTSLDGTWYVATAQRIVTANADYGILIGLDERSGANSSVVIDDVYLSTLPYGTNLSTTEWIEMGKYYLDSWKNDIGALTVTLIGHDSLTMLDNISYGSPGKGANMTLYDIAVDVFNTAGITNYSIDNSLKNYTTTTGFKESITCRVALQHIGIAGMAAVYQDRNGTMQIKPFLSIDTAGNYTNYAGGSGLYAGFNPFNTALYAEINDGNGMKRMDLNNMWTVPEISLEKSIYQLVIKVYSDVNTSTDFTATNTAIVGQSGQSFSIDNPLINTNTLAQSVANWFMNESNYNVVYKANWRGNPILEGADVVIISDGIDTTYAKQGRIYKQEFQYAGYLTCQTEARGGV